MKKIIIVLLFGIFSFPCLVFSQEDDEENKESEYCVTITNKKAIALYKKALDRKKYDKREERMGFLNKALELEPDFVEVKYQIAKEFLPTWKLGKMKFAPLAAMYREVIRLCPQYHSDPYYYLGFDYYENGRDDSAMKFLNSYINFKDNDNNKFAKDYDQQLYNAKMMVTQLKLDMAKNNKNVPFDPHVVLPISTKEDEFLCYISPDDSLFLFTRRSPFQSKNSSHDVDELQEMFMIARKQKDGNFDSGEPMPFPFNKNFHEGGPTITIDGKRLYYTVVADDGAGPNPDIYFSDYTEVNGWTKPQKVANINDPIAWDSQPTISADGNTIFFASNRDGGYGKTDLYMAIRNPKTGLFGKPLNLGPGINTPSTEKCPFVHSDSETLYYCSDGLPDGYGGLDIYYVRRDEPGNWMRPVNIGAPINSAEDDAGFFVSTDGKWGYFAAEPSKKVRNEGVGKYDVYKFELYKEARPQEVVFIRGELKDKDGGFVKGAEVEIKNPDSREKINAVVDSSYGTYVAAVNKNKFKDKVIVNAKKDGNAFSATVVEIKDQKFDSPPKNVNLEVKEIKVNEKVVINEIHYKTNSAELDPISFVMLNEFAQWLKDNPKMKIEIGGHTDNVGKPAANLALSSDRAFTVKAYLEDRGIEGKRITSKGYGDTVSIEDNSTEEGKAANRRTEFKILAK